MIFLQFVKGLPLNNAHALIYNGLFCDQARVWPPAHWEPAGEIYNVEEDDECGDGGVETGEDDALLEDVNHTDEIAVEEMVEMSEAQREEEYGLMEEGCVDVAREKGCERSQKSD